MSAFKFQEMFPLEEDATEYRLLSTEHVSVTQYEGGDIVTIAPEALSLLSEEAFRDVSHLMRTAHLKKVSAILDDPEASRFRCPRRRTTLSEMLAQNLLSPVVLAFAVGAGAAWIKGDDA